MTGIICTYLIRKVKYIHLNESKWIAYSTYILFLSAIIIIILEVTLVNPDLRETLFVLRSSFILLPITATNLFLFLPKIYYYSRGKDTSQREKHSFSTRSNKTSTVSSTTVLNDIERHRQFIENEDRVGKLEKKLNDVRVKLEDAKRERNIYKRIEALYIEKIVEVKNN